jgi:hypothetical protein
VLFVVLGVPFASAQEQQKPASPPGQSKSDEAASSQKDTATDKTPPGQQSKSDAVSTTTSGTSTSGQQAQSTASGQQVQSDALATATTTKSSRSRVSRQAPSNVAPPSINGVAVVGATLTATTGTWNGASLTYAYQWQRCGSTGCSGVTGASNSTYGVATGDVGATLRVVVTASNRYGSQSATSAATSTVLGATPIPAAGSYPASFFTGPAGSGNVLPASGAFLGLATDATSPSSLEQNLVSRETQLGRKLNVDHLHYAAPTGGCYYYAPFSQGIEQWAWGRGVYSFVSWSPSYTIAQVNSGAADACFRDVAQRFAAFGHPVWLRLWWEFSGSWFPWKIDPSNPQAFITAWQRVVGIFKAAGATNTMFVWSPDEGYYDQSKTLQENGYPGDAYVDWVGSDGYNWNSSGAWCGFHAGWCEFWEVFHHGYAGAKAVGIEPLFRGRKPFVAGETATVEDPANPARKGQWMTNMESSIKSDFPDLRMLLYFDVDQTATDHANWRIDTSSASLAGFKTLAQDPYFNPS